MSQTEQNTQSEGEVGRGWGDWLQDAVLRALIGGVLMLPYHRRVPLMGWLTARLIAPLAGYNRRSRNHLAFIHPRMSAAQRQKLALQVADNMGRTLIENYSGAEFLDRMASMAIRGPGLATLDAARAAGRPVILVSGHIGNYEAPRAALTARGLVIGGLYRPARNKFFDDHYARTMLSWGGPVFAQGQRGTAGFVRHLRAGGMLVLLTDQFHSRGPLLDFLGRPAPTSTSAAELALRYGAALVPFYGIRQPDGLNFDIVIEEEVPHGDPIAMTQALNASLAARIAANPGQWLWVHRRWKPGRVRRQRRRAAASTRPGPGS